MSIPIILDKPRELLFNIPATKELEQAMGKPLGLVLNEITNFGVTAIITALYIGLKHEDKGLNLSLVTKLFDAYVKEKRSLRKLISQISDALDETGLFQTEEEANAAEALEREGNALAAKTTS